MYSPSRRDIQLRFLSIQFLLRNREDAVVIAKYGYSGASLPRARSPSMVKGREIRLGQPGEPGSFRVGYGPSSFRTLAKNGPE
jgi:hypothetical protein